MSLESINQDQFEAFVQVLKKRINELDQESKLPSNKRRLDREIEFDKRLILQSLNAILKYKNQEKIRIGLIANNLFGPETPTLFAQFQEALERQQQEAPLEIERAKSAEETSEVSPVVGASQEAPPAPTLISEGKEQSPDQRAGMEISPIEGLIPAGPSKLPEPVTETTRSPSQVEKEPVDVVPSATGIAVPQPEEAPGVLTGSPVALPEQESPVIPISTTPPEPVIPEIPAPPQPSIISQAPFDRPVLERDLTEEEPTALPEEPGVPWNGTLRVGNIFKGQKSSYQLEKCLHVGKYCEAWKAVVIESDQVKFQGSSVALKIANPGLTIEEKQRFEAEINVLVQLRNHTLKNLIRINGKLLVPEVFEIVQDPVIPPQRSYYAQSLAIGRPIDELRREKSRLPEHEALNIIAQFCRVLQALHEGLRVSLVDFDAENIIWDEQERLICVIDWKHLSTPEHANFAGDVISAASELYRMLMGAPAPIPGSPRALAEPLERWGELSQGAQDILMHAFDPFRPYQTAIEMREELEWLGEWWNRPGSESIVQFKNLFKALPKNEQLADKKHAVLLEKTLWAAGVLEKMATRPENEPQPWVLEYHTLRNRLNRWQTGIYWIEKGKRSYRARSWDLADQDFSQALKDAKHVLEATRWLQAVKAARSNETNHTAGGELDIARVEEAMDFLQQGKFAGAASLFEQLVVEPGQQDFDVLATESRLQEALQRTPGLLEGRQYKELAEVYQNAIQWMGKLPQGYQEILKPGFEDFEVKQRVYASRYKKFQKLQERFDQLKAARQGEFSEYYGKLKELFDQQPGDVELLKRGKEEIYQLLSRGKYVEGRALAALCLDYGCEADPYLHQVWQYACQLERCWQAWARGSGPAFRNALLNQAWPSELWAKLVEKILEKSLELSGEYFVAEFLDGILSSSNINYTNEEIRERLDIEKTRLLSKIEQAFQWDEEAGTDFLVDLMQEHPYSMALFNEAAAKVEVMLQHNNFSAALKIAQTASTQFSILDLQGDSESMAQVLDVMRRFLSSAARILPLQNAWLSNRAAGLAQQLELDNPWREGARWGEDEFVFLRDFLNSCMGKLVKDFPGWNLVFTKIDKGDSLYQRLADKREELNQEFIDDTKKRLQADPQSGLENLRDLWKKYPLDPILEQVSLEALDYDFLFKDEHAQKAHKIFNKLSGCSQTLKERIELSVKNAQFYRMYPDSSEIAYKELLDQLSESQKRDHLTQEEIAFVEAVRLSWFKQALENEDLAALQKSLTLLPKDKWAKTEVEALNNLRKTYTQKVEILADSTSEALKKGEQIEQQPVGLAAKLMRNVQKPPDIDDTLLGWKGLIDSLRTWIEKTRQAGWNDESFRLESYLEKLTKLYARVELLTTQKMRETNLVLIAELWKLALPGTPEDPQGDPKEIPQASEDNRRQWLLQMDKACQELIKNFPKDSQKQAWAGWQTRIQAELRKIQKP